MRPVNKVRRAMSQTTSSTSSQIKRPATDEAYLAVDEGVASSEVLTTEDIVHSITEKDFVEEEEDDEEIPPSPPPPTVTEVRDAIKTLRPFIESQSGVDHQLDLISNLNDYVEKSMFQNLAKL